jgi:hypothetical protein
MLEKICMFCSLFKNDFGMSLWSAALQFRISYSLWMSSSPGEAIFKGYAASCTLTFTLTLKPSAFQDCYKYFQWLCIRRLKNVYNNGHMSKWLNSFSKLDSHGLPVLHSKKLCTFGHVCVFLENWASGQRVAFCSLPLTLTLTPSALENTEDNDTMFFAVPGSKSISPSNYNSGIFLKTQINPPMASSTLESLLNS